MITIMIILFIDFIFFAQVGMALILLYMLLLCIGTKCTHLICDDYSAHYDAYNPKVHIKAGWKKIWKFSKSFLFFINLRNNILHEYKYNGRYFGLYKKCEAIWREKKECTVSAVSVYI